MCLLICLVTCLLTDRVNAAVAPAGKNDQTSCGVALTPRPIDASAEFTALVDWIYDDVIVARGAPGLVVGVSGTDSAVAFLAAAEAFARAGRPERAVGVHFTNEPSWFQTDVMPWLTRRAPGARLMVDGSIDARRDGLRWGALLEWSVVADPATGRLRAPEDRYWVVGTRNRTEDVLGTYSNASVAASVQPLVRLWKSEILEICRCLDVPSIAVDRSRDADCTCGRDQLPALHIPEVDALLMIRARELAPDYARLTIPAALRSELDAHLDAQLAAGGFKRELPYVPDRAPTSAAADVPADDARATVHEVLASDDPARTAWAAARAAERAGDAPEAMALLNAPTLRPSQRRAVIEGLLGPVTMTVPEVARLGRLLARIGFLGFSFPRWRFLTAGGPDGPSLIERFGFERLTRANDVRDPARPPSDPERDEFGPGFVRRDGAWTIEMRRAYLRITRAGAGAITLVIRNNSTYFGRDRLDEPSYVSCDDIFESGLRALDQTVLTQWFRSRGNLFEDSVVPRDDRLARLRDALDKFDEVDAALAAWVTAPDGGLRPMTDLLERKLRDHGAPTFAGYVRAGAPSWWPENVDRITEEWLAQARAGGVAAARPGHRFVLMSGPDGDRP